MRHLSLRAAGGLLLVALAATIAGVRADNQVAPKLPVPENVSRDPSGAHTPTIELDPLEMTPTLVATANHLKIQSADTTDWSVEQVGAPDAWKAGITGKGVTVAVLDTGVDQDHRDLKAAIKAAKDFSSSRTGVDDRVGHGTHCAGSIGARQNGWGLQGVAYECDLLIGKVLGDTGSGGVDDIAAGIRWAVDSGADVISMSLGGAGKDTYIPAALQYAEAAGVIVVAAAGNDGNGRPVNYPAAYEQCVAVSAVDKAKRLATFSCTGVKVEVCGPGVGVRSTYPGDKFADLSGTSMSTPNVAGYAALWVQANAAVPKKDRPAAFRKHLASGALEDLGVPGRDISFGYGLPKGGALKKTEPTPTPPAPGKQLELTEKDLTPEGQKKLRDAGWDNFQFRLGGTAPPRPEVPKVDEEELLKRLKAGEKLLIAFGVKADPVRYPGIVEATYMPEGIDPGVYEAEAAQVIRLNRVDGEVKKLRYSIK